VRAGRAAVYSGVACWSLARNRPPPRSIRSHFDIINNPSMLTMLASLALVLVYQFGGCSVATFRL